MYYNVYNNVYYNVYNNVYYKLPQGKSTAVHINQNLDNSERDLSELVLKSLHQTKLNLSN